MFAVTQEDFVHPMAVVELLWRSCCASESEKQEGSLTTRLKVRQWTQMLVDHSLLLGSSSEGIHLHDIVLQYLRKRLSAGGDASGADEGGGGNGGSIERATGVDGVWVRGYGLDRETIRR